MQPQKAQKRPTRMLLLQGFRVGLNNFHFDECVFLRAHVFSTASVVVHARLSVFGRVNGVPTSENIRSEDRREPMEWKVQRYRWESWSDTHYFPSFWLEAQLCCLHGEVLVSYTTLTPLRMQRTFHFQQCWGRNMESAHVMFLCARACVRGKGCPQQFEAQNNMKTRQCFPIGVA